MIQKLKMVNWKSHSDTEMHFSPATNLLIGTMGSGKTSCLDAICFAFFGSFPSLKSRQVNLTDVIMSRPDKRTNALVEVTFTTNEKTYSVTRTVSSKGSEAFLRCDGALLEGPQPIRTTEAVTRLLKVDYDTFARVIYGEQNKLDYFLTLPKGARKAQLDDVLGISLFEKVRLNCNSATSKLKAEKTSLEAFLSGVNVENIEMELNSLKKSLQVATERKNTLQSSSFSLTNEFEMVKKNLESLEELKKINEELSLQLVKTQTEANSLHSSAVSIMPQAIALLSREQCTSLLEQCSRSIQERTDLEQVVNELNKNCQRFEGEALAVKSIIEQFPIEKLANEISALSDAAKQLEIASAEFLDAAKKENTLKSTITTSQSKLAAVTVEESELSKKLSQLAVFQTDYSAVQVLEEKVKDKRTESLKIERIKATKLEVISALEKSLSLLQKQHALCPTCDQAIPADSLHSIIAAKQASLESEKNEIFQTAANLQTLTKDLTVMDAALSKWVELLPFASTHQSLQLQQAELQKSLSSAREELALVSVQVNSSKGKVDDLKRKTSHLDVLKQNLLQAEKATEKLTQIEIQLNILKEQLAKKNLALSTFESKEKIENKLAETRAGLKAFELFEKTEALKAKSIELSDKLSHLQFNEATLVNLRNGFSSISSNLQSTKVSLEYVNEEIREKTDLTAKLELQFVKLSNVKKNLSDLERKVHELTIFQNSLVETQGELRIEFIAAVNEAMHEVWKNIYPYGDYSSCKIVASEEDYALEVLSSDGWKPIEQCSGGEKTSAALALRVSLAMVLVPNLSWLVLDEPTHNLDSNGVNLLARALHETLPSIVRQTFVVTHDEALKEGASGAVHFFSRDKDNSGATMVETLS